ncbi:SAM-dependent methyltransferase [Actinomadura harenae]|nr:SAM-dependent methyltransferase [Actinomadura harenae]
MSPASRPPRTIDIDHPQSGRMYDYLRGGSINYVVDRRQAEHLGARWPGLLEIPSVTQDWTGRAVRLMTEGGVRQFLDLGAGFPSAGSVHEVARRTVPARTVCVDNDPVVLGRGRALLPSREPVQYVGADVRDVDLVLAAVRQHLDFEEPVALIAAALLQYLPEDPAALVAEYVERLAPGSWVAITHAITDGAEEELLNEVRGAYPGGLWPRPLSVIEPIFDGLALVEPGVVDLQTWRPDRPAVVGPLQVVGGLARVG